MAQQTAVDFIIENLPQIDWDDPFYIGLLQQAKAMQKEQSKRDYYAGIEGYIVENGGFEQYYNETYNK
jgi:hypothetical protein